MKKLVAISAVGILAAAPVFAGGMAEKVTPPTPVVVAPVVPVSTDWTGWYGGAQLGYGHTKSDNTAGGSGAVGGVHVGYLKDMGSWVLGGELNYNQSDMKIDNSGKVNHLANLELQAGPKFGNAYLYGILGVTSAKATFAGGSNSTDSGLVAGIGLDYMVSPQWSVDGQLTTARIKNMGASNTTLHPTVGTIGVSYHF